MEPKPDRPQRRSIRLPGYDYARSGAYFVTICIAGRECLLGEVVGNEMHLKAMGEIVWDTWQALPHHYANVGLDSCVVMPNHVHAVITLANPEADCATSGSVGAGLKPAPTDVPAKRHGLSEIVRALKTFSARQINEMRNTPGAPVWQRNYYEHVIRGEEEWNRIREYIHTNPARWALDRENPAVAPRGT